jgi:hypothetical protein
VFALLCALLQLNFALEDELVADTTMDEIEDELDVEEDPIYGLGRWGGLGYGGRHGGWGYGRGVGRVWDDEETEEDPSLGLGRWGGLGYGGRHGGWGYGRGVGRVWDEEESDEEIENDEDAVVGLRGLGRMGRLGMGHRLGLGLHGLRSHRMGLHGLGMLGRRHGLGSLRRGLWDEDESEDEENDAILGRRHGLGGWGGRLGGWGLRGLWDEEEEDELNEPQRGGRGNFLCRQCRRTGRQWTCRTCRRQRNEDEVSDLMLTGRRMVLVGCRGLGCMRKTCHRCRKPCMRCLGCPLGRVCSRICRRVLC